MTVEKYEEIRPPTHAFVAQWDAGERYSWNQKIKRHPCPCRSSLNAGPMASAELIDPSIDVDVGPVSPFSLGQPPATHATVPVDKESEVLRLALKLELVWLSSTLLCNSRMVVAGG